MKRVVLTLVVGTTLIFLGSTDAALAALSFTVQTVQHPSDPTFTELLGINNAGTIAGFYGASTPQGFTLTLPGSYTSQNFPGSVASRATAINNSGNTVGSWGDAMGNTFGYVDIGGTFTTLMAPATLFNAELGINNADTTVGYSSLSKPGLTGQTAYRQSGGVYTSIDALLPANQNSQATGINDAGEIVGFYQPASSSAVGFVDVAGSISTIAPFGSANTRALGVNNAGEIVGVYADATSRQHGYVYHDGVFTAFDPPGSTSTTINGVNDNGVIVGYYSDANSNVIGFVGNPVQLPDPVPSTSAWVLFALSSILALLGLRGGRRRAARAGRLRPGGRLSDGTVRSLHGLPNHSRG